MYIIKNAFRNIMRSKGRNVLILVITLVITISTCIALCIRQSADDAKASSLEELEVTAEISVNRMSFMQGNQSTEPFDREAMQESLLGATGLDLEELLVYADSTYIKDFYYTMTVSFNGTDDFQAVNSSSTNSNSTSDSTSFLPEGMDMTGNRGRMGVQGDFSVTGYSSHNTMTDFTSGVSSISEGTVFDETSTDYQCIINQELATYNSISVGDSISLVNPNNEEEVVEFVVCGIYTTTASSSSDSFMANFNTAADSANQIYTNYNALNTIVEASTSTDESSDSDTSTALMGQTAGTYVFTNVDNYYSFVDEVETKGLDTEAYTVSSNDLTAYENSLLPLENLSNYALYFLFVVIAIGAIILVVFNIFAIRERKYEIGVLAAIGMNKKKVALQFVSEALLVTAIAVILGVGIGSYASQPIANTLLENQVSSVQNSNQSMMDSFGGGFQGGNFKDMMDTDYQTTLSANLPTNNTTNYIDSISTGISTEVFMQVILIGLLLTLFSSMTAVVFILRYDPLKILSNRS